jgi:hypothetical protein
MKPLEPVQRKLLGQWIDPVVILTPFAVETRYPGDTPHVLPGQERDYFGLTARVRARISPELQALLGERGQAS